MVLDVLGEAWRLQLSWKSASLTIVAVAWALDGLPVCGHLPNGV